MEEQKIVQADTEQEQQHQEQQQQINLTPELLGELESLILEPKLEIKKTILNIFMQALQFEQQRALLEDRPIFLKQFMNLVREPSCETAALTCLIQMASDTIFHEQLHQLNAGDRIINNVKDVIEDIVKNDFQMTEKQGLIIQLSCYFLNNFTASVQGKNSFLSMSREDQDQGLNILIMMKIFQNEKTAQFVKQFPAVLVNISSYETGRKLLIQDQNEFLEICTPYILHENYHMRNGIIKSIRNVLFEYENEDFVARLFSEKIDYVNTICKSILQLINNAKHFHYKGLEEGQKSEKIQYLLEQKLKKLELQQNDKQQYSPNSQQIEEEELGILLDCLLILTNVDFTENKPHFSEPLLKDAIEIVTSIKLDSELTDKIEVIQSVYQV